MTSKQKYTQSEYYLGSQAVNIKWTDHQMERYIYAYLACTRTRTYANTHTHTYTHTTHTHTRARARARAHTRKYTHTQTRATIHTQHSCMARGGRAFKEIRSVPFIFESYPKCVLHLNALYA